MDFASRSDQINASQRTAALCRKFSEITTPTFGVVIDDKGAQQPMSGIRLAAHWRERERASPRMLVRVLSAHGDQVISAKCHGTAPFRASFMC